MSMPRKTFYYPMIFTAEQLWNDENYSIASLIQSNKLEKNGDMFKFINCLIRFKNALLLNNSTDETPGITQIINDLHDLFLKEVNFQTDTDFRGAVLNLTGLIYWRLSNHKKALESFTDSLSHTSDLLSKAVIQSNYSLASKAIQTQKAPAAIIYDCDDVLSNSRGRKPTKDSPFIIDNKGNMDGNIIAVDKLIRNVRFSIEHHIPLYVITARPAREGHVNFISALIKAAGGFHDGIGGFKPETIHCLGIEEFSEELGRPHVTSLAGKTKLARIKEIHEKELSHLPRNRILFVEDSPHNLDPVKEAGYSTILAYIGNDEHHDKTYAFLSALINTPYVSTHGNYAVLVKPEQLHRLKLDQTEFIEPSGCNELREFFWRKRMIPNFNLLAEIALKDRSQRERITSDLIQLASRQAIFFTDRVASIEEHILKNSFGTVLSIRELADKKMIFLVGSEGQRKINPLISSLSDSNIDLKDVAIIGLPADSGVSCQPVEHEEILLGCKNRLNQVICFKQGLELLLKQITSPRNPHRIIISITIENGIGLWPVESVDSDGVIHLADAPITSKNGTQFHFYDQAHLLYQYNEKTLHKVAKPTRVEYILTSDNLEDLKAYFKDGKPTEQYYLKQSEWSWEMLARRNSDNPNSANPYRYEGERIISSDVLIQEALSGFFQSSAFKLLGFSSDKRLGFFENSIVSIPDNNLSREAQVVASAKP